MWNFCTSFCHSFLPNQIEGFQSCSLCTTSLEQICVFTDHIWNICSISGPFICFNTFRWSENMNFCLFSVLKLWLWWILNWPTKKLMTMFPLLHYISYGTLKTRFYEKKTFSVYLILFLLGMICDDETKTKTCLQIYLHLQLNFKKIPIIAVNFWH